MWRGCKGEVVVDGGGGGGGWGGAEVAKEGGDQ